MKSILSMTLLLLTLTWAASCAAPTSFVGTSEPPQPSAQARTLAGYDEPWRPQFHFSPASNWMNDPNGMVYYAGEYHLFYQNNPYDTVWGPMHWGHAVSTDMVHWTQLPIALYPDSNGAVFSGSAVVDWNNTAGFQTGPEKALVAIFTSAGSSQSQSLAYSNDKGRTWTKYPGNPVIPNPGLADFRDPKVFWHAATGRWILSLAVHDRVRFYSSTNLKNWTMLSEFGATEGSHVGIWECPDLFPLAVDGGATTKWVLLVSVNNGAPAGGSGTQFFIGDFDGTTFTNNNPGQTNWIDYGKDNYAGVSWSDAPDGRRNYLGWMSNWNYAQNTPTSVWRSSMTVPRTLVLKTVGGQVTLVQTFVSELASNRGSVTTLTNKTVVPGANLLSSLSGQQYEILAEFQDSTTTAAEYGFRLRTGSGRFVTVAYHRAEPVVFVDRRFTANTGFSTDFPNVVGQPMVAQNGKVKLHILMDRSSVEVIGNDGLATITDQIFPDAADTGIELYSIGANVTLNSLSYWPIANQAPVQAPDNIDSDLGTLTNFGGAWTPTPNGLMGKASGDAFALALGMGVKTDVTLKANLRIGTGGAAAVAFRANSTATSGYVANIDSGGLVKLWKIGGSILGSYPTTIVTGQDYVLTAVAKGSRLQVYLGGLTTPVIDVVDASLPSGYVGLNLWNGTSLFQHIRFRSATGFSGNLGTLTTVSGTWSSTPIGLAGASTGDGFAIAVAKGTGTNFTYSGTVNLDTSMAGALVFRANAAATQGYVANVDAGGFLKLWKIGGAILAMAYRPIEHHVDYRLTVKTSGSSINVFLDSEVYPAISVNDSSFAGGYWGLNTWSGSSVFQNVVTQ